MKITYNMGQLPERKRVTKESEETLALKAFMADGQKKNMVIEYDDAKELKRRYDALRNFRRTNNLQEVLEMWRTERHICIVKTKKGPTKKS